MIQEGGSAWRCPREPPGGANSLDFAEPWSEGPGGSSFKSFKVQYPAHFKGNIWERFLEVFEFTVKRGKLFLLYGKPKANISFIFAKVSWSSDPVIRFRK